MRLTQACAAASTAALLALPAHAALRAQGDSDWNRLEALAELCAKGDQPAALKEIARRLQSVTPESAPALEVELALVDRMIRAPYIWKNAIGDLILPETLAPLSARVAWLTDDVRALHPLGHWQFVGPFDNERGRGMTRPTPAEKEPSAESYDGKIRPVAWREAPVPGHDGVLYLGELVHPTDQICLMARTWVHSEEEQEAVLLVGAMEELRVWWNGAATMEALGQHGFGPDAHAARVELRAGWNELSLKIGGQDLEPFFAARLVHPVTGVALELESVNQAPDDLQPLALEKMGRRLKESARVAPPGARAFFDQADPEDTLGTLSRGILEMAAGSKPRKERPGFTEAQSAFDAEPGRVATALFLADAMRVDGAIATEEDVNPWLDLIKETVTKHGPLPQFMAWYAEFASGSQGLVERALELTEQTLLAYPSSVLARLREIEYLSASGQSSLARLAAERLANEETLVHWPTQLSGLAAYLSPDDPAVVSLLEMAAQAGEAYAKNALQERKDTLAGEVDVDALRAELAERFEREPYEVGRRIWGGRRLLALGEHEAALALLEEALSMAPERPDLNSWHARTLMAMGQMDGAIAALEKSVELDPSSTDEERLLGYLKGRMTGGEESVAVDDSFHSPYAEDVSAVAERHPADEVQKDTVATAPRDVLLHRQVVEVSPNGTARRYHRVVERVLSEAGVRELDRRSFRAYAGDEDLRVLSVRVLHPDGSIEEGQTGRGANLTIDLPPLGVGDVVDIEWRRDDLRPSIFGTYFGLDAAFTPDPRLSVAESEIVVIALPDVELYFHVTGTDAQGAPIETSESRLSDGGLERSWKMTDLAPRRSEALEPPPVESLVRVQASTYPDWESFGTWWWSLIREEIAVSPEMKDKVTELTAGATTPLEKLRAIYDFVVTDIRYNAWEFGVHGYQPYSAPVIFSRRFGDCKDKAIVLRAMLGEAGIEAWPVLIRSDSRRFEEDHELPLVKHFNHCIAHVPAQDGIPEMFLDGTARLHPLEVLPDADRGAKVLTVRDDSVSQMQIPFTEAQANSERDRIEVDLTDPDAPRVSMTMEPTGRYDPKLRYRFAADETRQAEAAERMMTSRFGALRGDVASEHGDYEDLTTPLRATFAASLERVGRRTEGGYELPTSFAPYRLVQGVASESQRATDLLLDVPWSGARTIVYTLPAGASLKRVPSPVSIESPDLTYKRSVEVSGEGTDTPATVTVQERIEMRTHRVPAERYQAFRKDARAVDSAQRQNIEIEVAR